MRLGKKINIRKQVIGENALYLVIWLCVFLVPFMNAGLMSEEVIDWRASMLSWLKILPFFLLFLLNHYVLFRYLHRRPLHWVYYLLTTLIVVGLFVLIELYERSGMTFAVSFGSTGQSYEAQHVSLIVFPWWGNMLAALLMVGANNLIRTFYRSMQKEEDSERLQRQSIQAEMYYLKHQINPHFLMNTLNNIHALVDIDTEAAKKCVIQLSDMMRYVVYDTGGNSISLANDIEFIKNYIALMRIRYTDEVAISFTYPQRLTGRVDVPPLIFIVFVENAFKHGVSYRSDSYIDINLDYNDGYVTAYFENSVHTDNGNHKPGIGLENVQKRLDLIYGSRYDLQIVRHEKKYCVTLKIPTLK